MKIVQDRTAAAARTRIGQLPVGTFVMHRSVPGIARVTACDEGIVTIEAFDSPGRPVAEIWKVPARECQPVLLPVQARVYWRKPESGQWLAGRITAVTDRGYGVRFPDENRDKLIPGDQLRVRWEMPVTSPVEVLAAGATESAYFRDARISMLQSLVAQRRACASFTAAISSAIEIFPHQIDTALTVLSDPVQRYLLADEVGLGKTIEAGLIIRQLLIDNPSARIAVIVPEVLRRQWRAELVTKFFIDDFPDATVRISSHNTPEKWSVYHGFDLVVVDEVHFLVQGGRPDVPPYPQLSALARSVERLLLLSATPSVSKPERHLAILHLLDPQVYKWEELPQFIERFDQHRELATSVDSLDADFDVLLPDALEKIRHLIPDDPRFEELASNVVDLLDDEGALRDERERPKLADAVEALRAHISETYRLHRRIIRHRRSLVLEDRYEELAPYEVTGRRPPTVLQCEATPASEALLDWQNSLIAWVNDNVSTKERVATLAAYGSVLATLATRIDLLSDDFYNAVRWRIHRDESAAERAGLGGDEKQLLRSAPVLPFEEELLAHRDDERPEAEKLVVDIAGIAQSHRRVVVFCGAGELATILVRALRDIGVESILEHTCSTDQDLIDQNLRRWRSLGGILVADASAEDGVNLQQADAVIHVRLPQSPNRLEQRIGRIDRYADWTYTNRESAGHYVVSVGHPADSFSAAWGDVLVTAFEAWTTSLSAIQDRLDDLQTELWALAAEHGPQRITDSCDYVRATLAEERRQVQTMDALDAVQDIALGEKVALKIGQSDAEWKRHEAALRRYTAADSGGIRLSTSERNGVTEFGVDLKRPPLVSPLMLRRFGRLPADSLSGVFKRTTALRMPGVRLFRLGNPFVSGLANVIAVDERGQACAVLRRLATEGAIAYFGFDVLIEADLAGAVARAGDMAQKELRRHADYLFEPGLARLWIRAGDDTCVDDEQTLRWLNRPYDNKRDVNIAGQPELLTEVFGSFESFANAAYGAERTVVEAIRSANWFRDRAERAHAEASRMLVVRRAQARARQAAGHLTNDTESYLFDVDVTEALVNALLHPSIRVVAASCVIGATWS